MTTKPDHGTVTFEGITYTLQQDAHIAGSNAEPVYEAHAVKNGDDYKVTWAVLPDWLDSDRDDESNACDWDSPIDVRPA